MSEGAFRNGKYPNYLAEIGIGEEEARKRVEQAFERPFSLIRRKTSATGRKRTHGAWWIPETSTPGQRA